MFNYMGQNLFDQFNVDPGGVIGRLVDLQRAGLEAVREMADNNSRAMVQLTSLRNPQEFLATQQQVLQSVAEQNMAVLTRLMQSAAPPAAERKGK